MTCNFHKVHNCKSSLELHYTSLTQLPDSFSVCSTKSACIYLAVIFPIFFLRYTFRNKEKLPSNYDCKRAC